MTWLCLEFCDNSTVIDKYMEDLSKHSSLMTAVSFERYQLGPNATLVTANVSDVVDSLHQMGIQETWAMLSSYPHPPEFIDWMRDAFENVDYFTEQCVNEALKYNYTGYNLDWEPTEGVVAGDSAAYTQFIDDFAIGLHKHNIKLQVDVAGWSDIWDYSGINSTHADYIISMSSYTSNDNSFANEIDHLIDTVDINRIGVGVEMVNASTGDRMPISEVKFRFDSIIHANINEIDIWRFPVPPLWWPLIDSFLNE